MAEVKNSDIVKQTLRALLTVAGRRTLDSYAVQVLGIVLKKLEREYDFLKFVEVKEALSADVKDMVTVASDIDAVEPGSIGEAIDTIIRVTYMDLEEDAGIYFITELKERLGETYVAEIRKQGVDLERIEAEQHDLYNLRERKDVPPEIDEEAERKKEDKVKYTWDTVSTWKYENNVCFLYDNKGTLLDTLQLDMIVEEYVRRVAEFKETSPTTSTMFRINEKEDELLKLLHSRDIDVDLALVRLHVSRQKLDAMVTKLLEFEMLQYVSDMELKITEKVIAYLSEKKAELAEGS